MNRSPCEPKCGTKGQSCVTLSEPKLGRFAVVSCTRTLDVQQEQRASRLLTRVATRNIDFYCASGAKEEEIEKLAFLPRSRKKKGIKTLFARVISSRAPTTKFAARLIAVSRFADSGKQPQIARTWSASSTSDNTTLAVVVFFFFFFLLESSLCGLVVAQIVRKLSQF